MNRYKAVKINGVKHDEHRYLMEQHIGRKLDRDELVHHKNENKRDNCIDNLEVISRSEHTSLHNKGIPKSEQHRKAISDTLKGRPNIRGRKLSDKDVRFIRLHYTPRCREFGANALAKKYNVSKTTILDIVHNETYTEII